MSDLPLTGQALTSEEESFVLLVLMLGSATALMKRPAQIPRTFFLALEADRAQTTNQSFGFDQEASRGLNNSSVSFLLLFFLPNISPLCFVKIFLRRDGSQAKSRCLSGHISPRLWRKS